MKYNHTFIGSPIQFYPTTSIQSSNKVHFEIYLGQSRVEIEHYSIVYLSRSKHCSAELPLRVVLMCAVLMHGYLISLCCEYEAHPTEGLRYSTSNAVKQ